MGQNLHAEVFEDMMELGPLVHRRDFERFDFPRQPRVSHRCQHSVALFHKLQ